MPRPWPFRKTARDILWRRCLEDFAAARADAQTNCRFTIRADQLMIVAISVDDGEICARRRVRDRGRVGRRVRRSEAGGNLEVELDRLARIPLLIVDEDG